MPSRYVRPGVCRLSVFILLGWAGLVGVSASGHATPTSTPACSIRAEQRVDVIPSSSVQTSQETTEEEEHVEVEGHPLVEVFFEIVILGPILILLLALLLAIPTTVLGVSLVMDGGCLQYLLFGLGWLFAVFYGLLFGGIVGDMILGWDALVTPLVHVFVWGYPVAAWWAHNKLKSMPREQYEAWDQSLTGGALLGFGAASAASLLRSVFALKGGGFGGFGGGSFGGGGASGSWSGAASAASAPSSAASAGVVSDVTADDDPQRSSRSASDSRGFRARVRAWADKFQWYHGLAFVLGMLVFVPVGLGTVHALQNTKVFVFVFVCLGIYLIYRFARRASNAHEHPDRGSSPRPGARASATWS